MKGRKSIGRLEKEDRGEKKSMKIAKKLFHVVRNRVVLVGRIERDSTKTCNVVCCIKTHAYVFTDGDKA